MTRDELMELSDLNYAEAMRDLSRRAGGAVLDEDGLLLFTGGHPLPVLANAAMRTDRRLGAADALERARAFFAARGRGFTILIRAHADADLAAAAAQAGLVAFGEMPAMVLDHRLPDAVPPRGIDLRPVTTADDVAAYGRVMGPAYATYGMPEDVLPAMLGNLETLRAPHIVAFVARVDGTPVAGAMTVVTHGVAGVYWVGTIPAGTRPGSRRAVYACGGQCRVRSRRTHRRAAGVAHGRAGLQAHGLLRGHSLSVPGADAAARGRRLGLGLDVCGGSSSWSSCDRDRDLDLAFVFVSGSRS